MNHTLHRFMCNLINELKQLNDYKKYHDEQLVDIPFIISSLYQSFSYKEEEYKEFISDLEDWFDYDIVILEPKRETYHGYSDNIITANIYSWSSPNYNYQLCFYYDDRDYGYCDCTPDMPDYREDKKCCGHGCDASFCRFTLNKVVCVMDDAWDGDEHDYWEFEDSFYEHEQALRKEKEIQEKELRIKELESIIKDATKRIEELMEYEQEYYEGRFN